MNAISIEAFFDASTGTVSYVVSDDSTGGAAVIDPVLDFDVRSGRTSTASADRIGAHVRDRELTLDLPDGSQFDHLFKDGETFRIGSAEATALLVPGHTPADLAYVVGDAVFVGDTLFMPDLGSARADFPGGDARTLYRSIRRLLDLPASTRVFVCHDYPPAGRSAHWQTTVAEQRAHNIHVHDGIGEDEFVARRQARDATLGVPTLILPSLQVNVRAGSLPPPDDNGVAYLRIPLNALPVRGDRGRAAVAGAPATDAPSAP